MNLTLNDFRSVLGKKNDGDVVMRLDQKGLEKANWGGFFRNVFGNVRKVTPSAEENMTIRASLMAAIRNSAEGKVLTIADLQRIESAMGIANGIVDDSKPLSRRSRPTSCSSTTRPRLCGIRWSTRTARLTSSSTTRYGRFRRCRVRTRRSSSTPR